MKPLPGSHTPMNTPSVMAPVYPKPLPGQHSPFGQITVTPFGQQQAKVEYLTGPMVKPTSLQATTYADAVAAVQKLNLTAGNKFVAVLQAQDGAFLATPISFAPEFAHLLNSRSATNVHVWADNRDLRGIVGNFRDFEAQLRVF